LCGRRTCPTRSLAKQILVAGAETIAAETNPAETIAETNLIEIAEAVTAEASILGRLGLEVACTHGSESAYNSMS
jgi:uncharacterized protein YqgV (UPF0045/DUF77 family)